MLPLTSQVYMSVTIQNHYQNELDVELIVGQIRKHFSEGAEDFQLAPVDQLHVGGLGASKRLLERLTPLKPLHVLEIGSGLGGLMRQVESHGTIQVTGIDICHEFNRLNRELSRVAVGDFRGRVVTADALALPFKDSSFDLIIFQHSLLNIPDTQALLNECHRLLREKGSLLLHEIFTGTTPEMMVYPVPWARSSATSHIISTEKMTELLNAADFDIQSTEDWTEEALNWRQKQVAKETTSQQSRAKLAPTMIFGQDFLAMGKNIVFNISNNAVRVVEILARAR
ncbi:class I SAM-dependent methyltransferase [Marinobacterium sp. xm-d-564]|uniref:class I SAM-dependent methyltransferase n=1 Tax=Marinobacterium sp. xm-d-564 TaxID=2497742 RepID=UPI0015697BBC|nr:class I SAM-dependent methyltransferase [Marinobacterium sp. xm-d-564]NRP59397.1 Sarcosine/dimethylglycine N-methyltransferase [Marinobacterium sp. xm-d-564]